MTQEKNQAHGKRITIVSEVSATGNNYPKTVPAHS
jgi:hypothetical protein